MVGVITTLPELFPVVTLWRAGQDILQIAPLELDDPVRKKAQAVAEKNDFSDFSSHVARVRRRQFVEIGLVSSSGSSTKSFQELDQIRQEISDAGMVADSGFHRGQTLDLILIGPRLLHHQHFGLRRSRAVSGLQAKKLGAEG